MSRKRLTSLFLLHALTTIHNGHAFIVVLPPKPNSLINHVDSQRTLSKNHAKPPASSAMKKVSSTSLQAGGGGGALFGNLFGNNNNQNNDPNAPKRLFDIPAISIKEGPLRFALGLHLIGQQNNPQRGTWKANQADDGILDMYFKMDETGMFSVIVNEYGISIDRYGSRPSLQYMLQESLILHELLDEIYLLAYGEDDEEEDGGEKIEEENRLIRFAKNDNNGDAIEEARKTLPARKEK